MRYGGRYRLIAGSRGKPSMNVSDCDDSSKTQDEDKPPSGLLSLATLTVDPPHRNGRHLSCNGSHGQQPQAIPLSVIPLHHLTPQALTPVVRRPRGNPRTRSFRKAFFPEVGD